MDVSRLAQDVLAYASQEQGLGQTLADAERRLREVVGQLGQVDLQLHAAQDQRRGYAGSI